MTIETSLHIVDPKNPGAVDEILNLGEYWDEAGMVRNRDEILRCNKEVKCMFTSAYHYLHSAKELQDDIENMAWEAADKAKLNSLMLELRAELTANIESTGKAAKVRHLFDSAITPDGLLDYADTIIRNSYRCYYLKSSYGIGSTEVIRALAAEFELKGYGVELYHQPLNPDRLQTLVVEELGLAVTVNPKFEAAAANCIDLDASLPTGELAGRTEIIGKDRNMLKLLMDEAVNRIAAAKKKHDEMEKSYIPNMDFDRITELRSKTAGRIMDVLRNNK